MENFWQRISENPWISDNLVQYGGQVLIAIIVLLAGWIFAGWAGSAVRRALARAKVDETLRKFLGKLTRWCLLTLVVLACLSIFGVETTSFAAVIGSAGIAIGLAFQGTLSNFAAGVMLLMFRPFHVGDVINVAGYLGKVNEIELFTTTMDTFDQSPAGYTQRVDLWFDHRECDLPPASAGGCCGWRSLLGRH